MPSRQRTLVLRLALAVLLAAPASLRANEAIQHVVVRADVRSKSALRVSSPVLTFDVGPNGEAAASIDYEAAARTGSDAEVVLAVETGALAGPGGAADVETALWLVGNGAAGQLDEGDRAVAVRWVGSGTHSGRLAFTLRAPVPGTYVLPVRLVLSTP